MRALILGDPEFHTVAPEVFKAMRRDQFPQVYTRLYEDVGLNADEYAAIGAAVDAIVRMKDGPGKAKRFRSLAVWTSRHLGLNGRVSDDPRRQTLVEDMFEWAHRHDGSRGWEVPPSIVLIGYVVGAAESALALGLPFDSEGLAETAHMAVIADGLPFSKTDVGDTLAAIVKHRPLMVWVLPEEVERQRVLAHDSLIRSLHAPDCAEWLREAVRLPDIAEWLPKQMRTPEERKLLRKRLAELKGAGLQKRQIKRETGKAGSEGVVQ